MKKAIKLIVMTTIFCIVLCFISCEEYGGTIIVTNNFSNEKTVKVYTEYHNDGWLIRYKEIYGTKDIAPGDSASFNVGYNLSYDIVWDNGKYTYKTIEVSGGKTVQIDIP